MMKVFRSISEAEKEKPWGIMAIGVFDGMHHGHREIFARARSFARERGEFFSVMTFNPHPDVVLGKAPDLRLIYSLNDRLYFFEEEGAEKVLVVPFSEDFSRIEPEEFVEKILLGSLDVKGVAVGENFRFGRDASGDAERLKRLTSRHGIPVIVVERQMIGSEAVSSSKIRDALRGGDIRRVRLMLGRDYSVRGYVVKGRGLARKLGFPTVNLNPEIELLLKPGVYAGYVEIAGGRYPSVIHWGMRPTVGDAGWALEFHAIGAELQVPEGEEVRVFFTARIRDIKSFPTLDALRDQISEDVKVARSLLNLK